MMSSFLETSSSQAPGREQKEKEKKKKKQNKRPGTGTLAALGVSSAWGRRAMTVAGFPTETAASQCPGKKPRPALPGDLEAWRLPGPLAGPRSGPQGQQAASREGCTARAAESRLHVELPVLQSEHEMRMMAMQMMTNSISDAMERYKELIQVNSSYRIRHSQLLREQAQLKNNIQILLNEKRELLVEQTELPASSVEAKRLCEEAGMNICDPSAKQQQV